MLVAFDELLQSRWQVRTRRLYLPGCNSRSVVALHHTLRVSSDRSNCRDISRDPIGWKDTCCTYQPVEVRSPRDLEGIVTQSQNEGWDVLASSGRERLGRGRLK